MKARLQGGPLDGETREIESNWSILELEVYPKPGQTQVQWYLSSYDFWKMDGEVAVYTHWTTPPLMR